MSDKRKQVTQQCKVVAHLATAIATVYSDYERVFGADNSALEELIDPIGAKTAALMETFGDILNGMDAVTEEDDWTQPIFKEAHRLFPSPPQSPLKDEEATWNR